jgi:glutathione S-transferase
MKLYDCATAPSPRRVRIFLAEKAIAVPTVQVNLRAGEQFSPAFRALNPACTVPVLDLENGTIITDAVAICLYFEDLQPEPSLIGRGAEERAIVTAWYRRAEREGFYVAMEAFRNATPGLKGRAVPGPTDYEQIPDLARRARTQMQQFFETMDRRLAESAFVAGAQYTIADITTLVAVDFARWAKLTVPPHCTNLLRWHAAISARPSGTV